MQTYHGILQQYIKVRQDRMFKQSVLSNLDKGVKGGELHFRLCFYTYTKNGNLGSTIVTIHHLIKYYIILDVFAAFWNVK